MINSKLNTNSTKFEVNDVWMQVVGGLNYFYHLTDPEGNQYSVCLYVYNDDPVQVLIAEGGHNPARNPNSLF